MDIQSIDGMRIVKDFLSLEEVAYWNGLMREDHFWDRAELQNDVEAIDITDPTIVAIDNNVLNNETLLVDRMRDLLAKTCGEDVATDHGLFLERCADNFVMGRHWDHLTGRGDLDFGPNGTRLPRAFNEFVTLLYFNDNYHGGQISFNKINVTVKPTAGMLVVFPCGHQYQHEVLPVTGGAPRLRMSKFWARVRTLRIAAHDETFANTIRGSMRYLSSIFPEEA